LFLPSKYKIKKGFPILGGRLLKLINRIDQQCLPRFPILGGRLLKAFYNNAAEGIGIVSNPWREAIEVVLGSIASRQAKGFQSLEGGY